MKAIVWAAKVDNATFRTDSRSIGIGTDPCASNPLPGVRDRRTSSRGVWYRAPATRRRSMMSRHEPYKIADARDPLAPARPEISSWAKSLWLEE